MSGNGSYTTPTGYTLPATGTVTGSYQWDASYATDGNNNAVSDNNNVDEQTVVSGARASVAAWTSDVDGLWNSGANWTNTQGSGAPGSSGVSGDQASFNGAAGLNVDLGSFSPSIAGLTFGPSALNYDIQSTGSGQLQLNNGSSNATITVSAGSSQTIAAPVVLESNVNVTLAGGASLTISGGIGQSGGGQSLTLTGSGNLTLPGSDNYTGGTTVNGGTLFVDSSSAIPANTGLTVGAGGTVVFGPSGGGANDTSSSSVGIDPPATTSNGMTSVSNAVSVATSGDASPSTAVPSSISGASSSVATPPVAVPQPASPTRPQTNNLSQSILAGNLSIPAADQAVSSSAAKRPLPRPLSPGTMSGTMYPWSWSRARGAMRIWLGWGRLQAVRIIRTSSIRRMWRSWPLMPCLLNMANKRGVLALKAKT